MRGTGELKGHAMPDSYLTVADFLAYDKQLMGKLGRIGDNVVAAREQVNHLDETFTAYRAETDAFRIQTRQDFAQINQRLDGIDARLDTLEQATKTRFDTLEQKMTQGFTVLFAHLGIR